MPLKLCYQVEKTAMTPNSYISHYIKNELRIGANQHTDKS
jgi:hypothetical protein